MGNFHSGYRDLDRKNRDLSNWPSPAFHMNISVGNFDKEKKRVARRDLGNRAIPVDRAHIKKP